MHSVGWEQEVEEGEQPEGVQSDCHSQHLVVEMEKDCSHATGEKKGRI